MRACAPVKLPYEGRARITVDSGEVVDVSCHHDFEPGSGGLPGVATYGGHFWDARAESLDLLKGASAILEIPGRAEERIQIQGATRSTPDGTVFGTFGVVPQRPPKTL